MLGETYDIQPSPRKLYFLFTSEGPKGLIEKVVMFEPLEFNVFNLAFGDIQGQSINDSVISNNQDFVKVLATVAKCTYDFVEKYPGVKIKITPVDEGRKLLYNTVFRRHHRVIGEKFEIRGFIETTKQPYSPEKNFDEFELQHII